MKFNFWTMVLFYSIIGFSQENKKESSTVYQDSKSQSYTISKKLTNSEIDTLLSSISNLKYTHPDTTLERLSSVIGIIEERKYYKGLINYISIIVEIYRAKGEMEKADKIVSKFYERYKNKLKEDDLHRLLFYRADIYNGIRNFKKSQDILKVTIPLVNERKTKAAMYFMYANNSEELGNQKDALIASFKSLDIYKSLKSWDNVSSVCNQIFIIYSNQAKNKDALKYAKLSEKYSKKSKNVERINTSYGNLVVAYKNLGILDSAIYYNKESIQYAKKYNRQSSLAQDLLNLGNIYQEKGDYKNAIDSYNNSLTISKINKIEIGIIYNYINLSTTYSLINDFNTSEKYLDSLNNLPNQNTIPLIIKLKSLEVYSLIYDKKGNYKKSLDYLKKLNQLNDSLNQEQTKKDIEEIQLKYNSAKNEVEIEKIKNENMIKTNRIKYLIGISSFLLIIILGIFTFKYFINKKNYFLYKKNVELIQSQKIKNDNQPPVVNKNNSLEVIFEAIENVIEKDKLYYNPDLTVFDLAHHLNTNQKYISTSISQFAGTNFNNFINKYRVDEAKRMILENEYKTLNEIMFASGFNSRTPFYNAFTKFTGLSPKKFRDLNLENNDNDII